MKNHLVLVAATILTLGLTTPAKGSDWKTYTNPSPAYSLQHPSDWQINSLKNPSQVWFQYIVKVDRKAAILMIESGMSDVDFQNLASPLGIKLMLGSETTEKDLVVNGVHVKAHEGILQATKTMRAGMAFLQLNGQNFVFQYMTTERIWPSYHSVFEQMLRSFNIPKSQK